jgi:spore maturation protein CgeB
VSRPFTLVFVGLSISSSWGNGHATTYRALIRALAARGHEVVFLERDVPWYASQRDAPSPEGCRLELYDSIGDLTDRFGALIATADAVIVGSYVPDGAEVLEWVLEVAGGPTLFYDIDTPVTLEKLRRGEPTYVRPSSIPKLDAYLSFTGGPLLNTLQRDFGAHLALPLYCSVDAERYRPSGVAAARDLGYELLIGSAVAWPDGRFVVAGSCYPDIAWPENVERLEHVSPGEHPEFYGSLRFALNLTRADMLKTGHAPSVRLFEAAACQVPVISDVWSGIEEFFEPGREILLARSRDEILQILKSTTESERTRLGERARSRVLREHTASHRARQLEVYLKDLCESRADVVPSHHRPARRPSESSELGGSPERATEP